MQKGVGTTVLTDPCGYRGMTVDASTHTASQVVLLTECRIPFLQLEQAQKESISLEQD